MATIADPGRSPAGLSVEAAGEVLVSVDELSIDYYQDRRWNNVIDRVSFSVGRGESFGLVGESGCGKSTVLRSLIGYAHPASRITNGRVIFDGIDLIRATDNELRKGIRGRRISIVPQDPATSLTPTMRVGRQVLEPLLAHRVVSTKEEAYERMLELLDRVRIPDPEVSASKFPHQLSGGQQQRVVIAMALAASPDLLLLDEPTTGLDVTTQGRILELLTNLRSQLNLSLVYVTHNLAVISNICDRVGVMYAGKIVEIAPTRPLFEDPKHPYTRGLMASVPRLREAGPARFPPLRGMLHREELPEGGCPFAPRCDFARDRCVEESQALKPAATNHAVACWRWSDQELAVRPDSAATEQQAQRVPTSAAIQDGGESKLGVKDLYVAYQHRRGKYLVNRGSPIPVLRQVNFEIRPGETLGLVGESGSGKSTIAKALIGLQPPFDGQITLDGEPVPPSVKSRSRDTLRRMQLVMQNPDASLNPRRRVVDIVGRPLTVFYGIPKRQMRQRVADLLLDVKLDHTYLNRFPSQMSGGERQRVAIARALAAEPDILLCDEIVSSLDVSVQGEVLELLRGLQTERGIAYLFISHDLAVVRSLAHRVLVLFSGEMMEIGSTADVYTPPTHPYTHVLLTAVPDVDPAKHVLTVEGATSDLVIDPTTESACAFASSCPWKVGAICDDVEPPWRQVSEDSRIRCHIPLDELMDRERGFHEAMGWWVGERTSDDSPSEPEAHELR